MCHNVFLANGMLVLHHHTLRKAHTGRVVLAIQTGRTFPVRVVMQRHLINHVCTKTQNNPSTNTHDVWINYEETVEFPRLWQSLVFPVVLRRPRRHMHTSPLGKAKAMLQGRSWHSKHCKSSKIYFDSTQRTRASTARISDENMSLAMWTPEVWEGDPRQG